MIPYSTVTTSEADTILLGKKLAEDLNPGDVVALLGDLGSGKTILVKGIAQGLGVTQSVHSPTFVIINEYEGSLLRDKITIFHFDFYRVERSNEQDELGLDELLWRPGSVSLIEWAERIERKLDRPHWRVGFERLGDEARKITVEFRK